MHDLNLSIFERGQYENKAQSKFHYTTRVKREKGCN